jgi:hypothetical protein
MAESITPVVVTAAATVDKQVIGGINIRMYRKADMGHGDMADCAVSVTLLKGTGDGPTFRSLAAREVALPPAAFLAILQSLGGADALLVPIKAALEAEGVWE